MDIKVGQVGIGTWGKHHCELLSRMPGVELVGLYDLNVKRCGKTASDYGTREFGSLQALLQAVEAVIITAPTPRHYEIAMESLAAGKHAFVEKPVCTAPDEAGRLAVEADRKGLVLQVGHIERFNPAFRSVLDHLDSPVYIEAHRLAPYSSRGTDVSVVLDLMIHDLDLVLSLVDAEPGDVSASGMAVHSPTPDFANARIRFTNGCVANLTASRVAELKRRQMTVHESHACFHLDFIARSAIKWDYQADGPADASSILTASSQNPFDENLLENELSSFLQCVRNGAKPMVDGFEGMLALKLATEIETCMNGR